MTYYSNSRSSDKKLMHRKKYRVQKNKVMLKGAHSFYYSLGLLSPENKAKRTVSQNVYHIEQDTEMLFYFT